MSAREQTQRYAQKSKLQSVLIRNHADTLVVEPTEADDLAGIALQSRLSSDATADSVVRGCLALALARVGTAAEA